MKNYIKLILLVEFIGCLVYGGMSIVFYATDQPLPFFVLPILLVVLLLVSILSIVIAWFAEWWMED